MLSLFGWNLKNIKKHFKLNFVIVRVGLLVYNKIVLYCLLNVVFNDAQAGSDDAQTWVR